MNDDWTQQYCHIADGEGFASENLDRERYSRTQRTRLTCVFYLFNMQSAALQLTFSIQQVHPSYLS